MGRVGVTVAVTGPTGEIGTSAVTALEHNPAVDRIVGMARRPFDPSPLGWTPAEPTPITGLDGKTYQPKPDVPKPKPPNTFSNRFYRALSQLQEDALRLNLLTKEEAFACG